VHCDFLFAPDQPRRAVNTEPAVRFWDQTNREDWHVCELAQRGIASRAYSPGPLSHLENITAAWDRHYLEVMERPNGRRETHG
jgi:Rieske 2Fe-2S family protein